MANDASAKNIEFNKIYWRKHRARAAHQCGVGKGMDKWGEYCFFTLESFRGKLAFKEASKAARDLQESLKKAKGRCGAKTQKHTIKMIDVYLKNVAMYGKWVNAAYKLYLKRDNYTSKMNLKFLESNKVLLDLFLKYTSAKQKDYQGVVFTYFAVKKDKSFAALKLYAAKHQTGLKERYNIILARNAKIEIRGPETPEYQVTMDNLAEAFRALKTEPERILTNLAIVERFTKDESFKKWANSSFPCSFFKLKRA